MNNQPSLFAIDKEELLIEDGNLDYYPQWLDDKEGFSLFEQLKREVQWEQSIINIYGKSIKIPRLNAWYGDANSPYTYSGSEFEALPWLPSLFDLKARIEAFSGFRFNSVLVNCYRDGNDSVAWHSDDELELGRNPPVASLSLGAERQFQLRHRFNKSLDARKLTLAHGSLLMMSGELQHYWHHQIPKTKKAVGERINLTFRYVFPKTEGAL